MVKSHGQHTYLEETMKSTQHVFYVNASLSSQVLCHKHYISMYLGECPAKLWISVNKIRSQRISPPPKPGTINMCALFIKYFYFTRCTKCNGRAKNWQKVAYLRRNPFPSVKWKTIAWMIWQGVEVSWIAGITFSKRGSGVKIWQKLHF